MFCSTKKISVNYNKTPVLKNVSIKIIKGQTTAIIGKNGSGKTTLLRCINCLIDPTSGSIKHSSNNPFPMLFQKPAKFHNTVYYNFEILCKIKKIKPLTKWYKTFGLEKISEKNINQVSGGEQQKTYLSRIMSANLKVIILDEPSQNLDKESDRKLIQLLLEEKIQEKTIIFSSHDLEMVKQIADKIIYLDNGNVLYEGVPKNII